MIYRRISSILFALAFISAIGVFTNYFSAYVPKQVARYLVFAFGGLALLVNVLAFRVADKDKTGQYNLIFWLGAIILFAGIMMRMMHWPYSVFVILAGILVSGVSFFYDPFAKDKAEKRDDLLD